MQNTTQNTKNSNSLKIPKIQYSQFNKNSKILLQNTHFTNTESRLPEKSSVRPAELIRVAQRK